MGRVFAFSLSCCARFFDICDQFLEMIVFSSEETTVWFPSNFCRGGVWDWRRVAVIGDCLIDVHKYLGGYTAY